MFGKSKISAVWAKKLSSIPSFMKNIIMRNISKLSENEKKSYHALQRKKNWFRINDIFPIVQQTFFDAVPVVS